MSRENAAEHQVPEQPDATQYEPPRVETVVTADELARDIQYAGGSLPLG